MLARWCVCMHGVLEADGRQCGEGQRKRGELEATWGYRAAGESRGGAASVGASGNGGGPRSVFDIALRTRHFNLKRFSYGRDLSRGESQSRAGHGSACPTEPAGEQAFFLRLRGRGQEAQSHHGPVLS